MIPGDAAGSASTIDPVRIGHDRARGRSSDSSRGAGEGVTDWKILATVVRDTKHRTGARRAGGCAGTATRVPAQPGPDSARADAASPLPRVRVPIY